ncbi:cupredoxin family copper-binding protein [Mesorhizobium sp. PAMC28654]|uniref:cupredoxin domain-containing protein n=1 Tax=Mesorhizobium sp. PAMC28654 TaxID=2880934 RepID=UPI0039B6D4F5
MIRFPTRPLVGPLAALGLAMVAPAPLQAADAQVVKIDNFTFTPAALTVKPGTTVTFENDDDIPHLVVANDGAFRSKALDTGDTYAFTFTKAGDFAYYCGLHPHMQGKITVAP